jgi:hypothetical protein
LWSGKIIETERLAEVPNPLRDSGKAGSRISLDHEESPMIFRHTDKNGKRNARA